MLTLTVVNNPEMSSDSEGLEIFLSPSVVTSLVNDLSISISRENEIKFVV